MSKNEALEQSYRNPLIGHGYDALSWLLYTPVGGRDALRENALDAVGVRPGLRVLELGCGTGGLTQKLLGRGASVTAVDWSEPMLRLARKRAPSARFVRSEITAYAADAAYDLVLFAFVLHELAPAERAVAFSVAKGALAEGGAVAVVDHAEPERGVFPRAIFAFMHAFEPSSMSAWARGRFEEELAAAGLVATQRELLGHGTARVVVARPTSSA